MKKTITQHGMLAAGDIVLVGLSGGADSVALLHGILTLSAAFGVAAVHGVHINHQLRGDEALADQNFVVELCKQLNIPLDICQEQVREYGAAHGLSIEEAGRQVRYHCFAQTAAKVGATKIATGHHLNDNAETVVMNLARGTGLRGLCGIPPVNGHIIRPLINITREAIEAYLQSAGLSYVTDPSNLIGEYARNRTRLHILPAMAQDINPQAISNIANTTALLREDEAFLETTAQTAFTQCLVEQTAKRTTLSIDTLGALHTAIQRRVLRIAISTTTSLQDIKAGHIEDALGLLNNRSGKEIHLPGLVIQREFNHLVVTSVEASPPPATHSDKNPGQNLKLLYTKPFNYGMLKQPVVIRTRRPGDRIKLQGNPPFTKKLQDYFTEAKTPRHVRDTIPVVAHGSDILWVLDEKGPTSATYAPVEGAPVCWISIWKDEHNA